MSKAADHQKSNTATSKSIISVLGNSLCYFDLHENKFHQISLPKHLSTYCSECLHVVELASVNNFISEKSRKEEPSFQEISLLLVLK